MSCSLILTGGDGEARLRCVYMKFHFLHKMAKTDVQRTENAVNMVSENVRLLQIIVKNVNKMAALSAENLLLREEAERLKRLILNFTDDIVPQDYS